MLSSVGVNLFKNVPKFSRFSVKFISTNPSKRTTEVLSVSKRDDYYKNFGESAATGDTKPPGWNEALPFEAIPGPKSLPIIGNSWRFLPIIGEYHGVALKDFYKLLKDKYGNIAILGGIFGRKPLIMLFDVDDMEKALRNEGPFPIRVVAESVVYYRTKVRNEIFKGVAGIAGLQGEEWFKFRSRVNPILMQPRTAQQYIGKMDKVAGELVENMKYFLKQNKNNEMPHDFQNELYKWALESVGVIALDKHLGCLDLNAPKESEPQRLIANVNEMFSLMYKLDILPPVWKYIETPTWKRFVKISDFITDIIIKYIEEAMNKVVRENAPEHQLSVTQRLTKQEKYIAVATVMDMLVAGIDTTGKTIATTLYFLARNPDKQRNLHEELLKNLPEKDSPVTKEVLSNCSYLKAVIKESMRIAPVAIANLRTSVKDMVLAGYRVPKGSELMTMHMISANSKLFKDADKFIPERWLRTTEDDYSYKNVHPFAFMPFGFGPRSCIGKRFANLELEVALAKIIRNLELSWHHEDMIFSGTLLYGISRPLKLKVKEL